MLTYALVVVVVGAICFMWGTIIQKSKEIAQIKSMNVGKLVMHVDGNELVATSLELEQDILQKETGDIVSITIEYRQHAAQKLVPEPDKQVL